MEWLGNGNYNGSFTVSIQDEPDSYLTDAEKAQINAENERLAFSLSNLFDHLTGIGDFSDPSAMDVILRLCDAGESAGVTIG